ncbi:MAG: methyltransferase domain-containing protein [candidate division WOR-3 bacterium]
MAKKYTVLETWIVNVAKPEESDSATQTYARLPKQDGGRLPVIDVEQNFYNEEHFYDEARIRDFAAHLDGCEKVLDIGPGDGWPLLRIAPFFKAVFGVDPVQRRLDVCQANAEKLGLTNVTLRKLSATALAEFRDNSFDGVVAASSIEQTPDPYAALREVFRVLRPGGKLRIIFESYDRRDRGVTESVFLTETEESLGYHYVLRHNPPPWERNYLVKFNLEPDTREAFKKLADLIERLGPNPSLNPEVGIQFLERNQAAVIGATWYELEHFTSATMKETLEEIGFGHVRITFSAATLARQMWPRVKDSGLTNVQVKDVLSGLADLAVKLEAPAGLGEPVAAIKPS